ncbi:MAG: aspartate carbamoyltransferase regulatory subunit, partial [Spirochaetota bacterium]
IFHQVEVDLIAPGEMGLPRTYCEAMTQSNFQIRTFASIDEYLQQSHIAPMWYFTRLQLERMDQIVLRREQELRYSVTLRPEHLPMLDKLKKARHGMIKFYHPMPRHKKYPVIPSFLDETEYNGWERQSANGLVVRTTLLALIAGRRPPASPLNVPLRQPAAPQLYKELPVQNSPKFYSEGLRPIRNGLVIDHILRGASPQEIRRHMQRILELMALDRYRGGQWVGSSHKEKSIYKGLIFLPDVGPFGPEQLRKLAAIAPHITINHIHDAQVQSKFRLLQPPRIYGFPEISCRNRNCISHESHQEGVDSEFHHRRNDDFICIYCHTSHNFQEIWNV